jgi:hypothetical protein
MEDLLKIIKSYFKWFWKVIIFIILYFGLIPKYRFSYYYSRDQLKVLTRVTYPNAFLFLNTTYLTPGKYEKHRVPDVYIKPIPENIDGHDWAEYVTFHSKGIRIVGQRAETKNLSDSFRFMEGSGYYNHHQEILSYEKSLSDTSMVFLYRYQK